MKVMHLRTLFVCIALGTLTACATRAPEPFTHKDPNVDFSGYQTYGYLERLSTDDGSTAHSNYLKEYVAAELEKRGLIYSDEPDLIMNFYIHTEAKVKTRAVPTVGSYYGYREPFYDTWGGYGGYETAVDEFAEGTLHIDAVDAGSKQLVWEGGVSGRLTEEVLGDFEAAVRDAVQLVMQDFPIG